MQIQLVQIVLRNPHELLVGVVVVTGAMAVTVKHVHIITGSQAWQEETGNTRIHLQGDQGKTKTAPTSLPSPHVL